MTLKNLFNLFLFFVISLIGISFAVDHDWQTPPTELESNPYGSVQTKLAMNNNGVAVAVWANASSDLRVANSLDGGITWEINPNPISESAVTSGQFYVEINEQGHVLVAFLQGFGVKTINNLNNGDKDSWGSIIPQDFSTSDNFYLTMKNTQANLVRIDYSDDKIYTNKSTDSGSNWDGWVDTTQLTDGTTSNPIIATNINNQAIVVWKNTAGSNLLLLYSTNGGSTWSPSYSVSDGKGVESVYLDAVINDNGHVVVVWEEKYPNLNLFTRHNSNGGAIGAWETINQITNNSHYTQYPMLKMNENDQVILIWTDEGEDLLFVSTNPNGGAKTNWSDPFNLGEDKDKDNHRLSLNNKGQAIVTWVQLSSGNPSVVIEKSSQDAGHTWSEPYTIIYSGPVNWIDSNAGLKLNDASQVAISFRSTDEGSNQKVYASSKSLFLPPLTSFYGRQEIFRSFLQKKIINQLFWGAHPDAIKYQIYSDAALTNLIFEGDTLYYPDKGVDKDETRTYYLIMVDNVGNTSVPIEISLP